MAKLNINTASRDELLEGTGLRAEIVDGILKLRDESGGIGKPEELEEVQGIGPATVEQVKGVLDFSRRGGSQATGCKAEEPAKGKADEDEAQARSKAEDAEERKRHEASSSNGERRQEPAGRKDEAQPAAYKVEEQVGRMAETAARQVAESAGEAVKAGSRSTIRTATLAAESFGTAQKAALATAQEGVPAALSGDVIQIISDQARDNLMLTMAMFQVQNWSDLGRMQSEYVRNSLDRCGKLASAYVEACSGIMRMAAPTSQPPGQPPH